MATTPSAPAADNSQESPACDCGARDTVPGAAESWEYNDDATQITFHLRPDLTYSDGSPLTAENFRYAIEDIRQKVVEAPTYGQEVTPSLHDGRLTQANAEHSSPHQQGSDPLMRAYAERRELTAADLYGRGPDQEKDREQQQVRGGIER